jgi:Heparinase II/III-like protein/Heparinase II/III N-terminus
MWNKLNLYFDTLKYLKRKQLMYRFYYLIRNKWRRLSHFSYDFSPKDYPEGAGLGLCKSIVAYTGFLGDKKFTFLNKKVEFERSIDWNYPQNGKLWAYNLNYFEFLHQADVTKEEGLFLIHDFIDKIEKSKDGVEPFPTALRIIFWIKFLTYHQISEKKIDQSLYGQFLILKDNIEFHLLGNHLLENAFALLFGAYYFKDQITFKYAEDLLRYELEEQILNDGGHFELSPMYHQHMLYRVLDCINLVQNNSDLFETNLLFFLKEKAQLMLSWISQMTYENGDIPLFNDSAYRIAPTTKDLLDYSKRLSITLEEIPLSDSGYRKFKGLNYESIVDAGNIGPDYIPGHAHCDMLSFTMQINNKPFLVDTGISTYEKSKQRTLERSTASHNTVSFGNLEQSQVWGGFRVGQRAKIQKFEETENSIKASHDGYFKEGVIHQRTYDFSEREIEIIDEMTSKSKRFSIKHLHFHPEISVSITENVIKTSLATIKLVGYETITLTSYNYAPEFNKLAAAPKINIQFIGKLTTSIEINQV